MRSRATVTGTSIALLRVNWIFKVWLPGSAEGTWNSKMRYCCCSSWGFQASKVRGILCRSPLSNEMKRFDWPSSRVRPLSSVLRKKMKVAATSEPCEKKPSWCLMEIQERTLKIPEKLKSIVMVLKSSYRSRRHQVATPRAGIDVDLTIPALQALHAM